MTIVDSLIKISEWLNKEVCPSFLFKKEPAQGKPQDVSYLYEEVNPYAFPMFIPAKDKLPPNVKTNMPSICVQLLECSDDTNKGKRDFQIQLGVSTWNPGVHAKDIYYPKGADTPDTVEYHSGYDGWMDTWNFIDAIVRKIESMAGIDGLHLIQDVPIKMGPFKEQEAVPDFYPHWFGYIQFTLRSDIVRVNVENEEFL